VKLVILEMVAYYFVNRGVAGLGYGVFPTSVKRWILNHSLNSFA